MTKKATISFSEYGGPKKLFWHEMELPEPSSSEVQIEQLAIGVNYIDIYHRQGVFAPKQPLPSGLGLEGVGNIIAVGADVVGLEVGDRIAYAGGPLGGYATHRNVPAARAVKVPEELDSQTVAAMFFKGLTAEYLVHRCVALQAGDTVLFHAAAGGVGSIACQWLKARGVHVIGTVSTRQKADVARANGCDEVILYTEEDFQQRVMTFTDAHGVAAVFDSVGAETFTKSLACLRPRGTLVSLGESSGPVPDLSVASLGAMGSLFVTRPSIVHYTAARSELESAAKRLFTAISDGTLSAPNMATYPFEDAVAAHSDMEGRRTTGSVLLIP